MKYAIFIMAFCVLVPGGALVASSSRRIREVVFGVSVFSTAFAEKVDINLVSREWYRAMTRGLEISFVDLLALILLLSNLMTMRGERAPLFWPASLGLMLLSFAYGCFSVLISDPQIFGMLELTKMLRGLVFFLAAAWFIRCPRDVYILAGALSLLMVYEGWHALIARYVWGEWRVQGTFPHPNFLAQYCVLVCAFLLPLVFSQTRASFRALWGLGWVFGALAVVLSLSRMGVFLLAVGTTLVLVNEIRSRLSLVKILLATVIMVAGFGMMLRSWDQISSRHEFMTDLEERGDGSAGRTMYYWMAWDMALAHPLGVGLNNWSWWVSADEGNPYPNTYEPSAGRAIFAHTLYGLTLGELGWPGFGLLMALWLQWFFLSGRFLFVRSGEVWTKASVGCFFALFIVGVNNLSECNFRSQHIFIIMNILLGYVAAVTHEKKRTRNLARPLRGVRTVGMKG